MKQDKLPIVRKSYCTRKKLTLRMLYGCIRNLWRGIFFEMQRINEQQRAGRGLQRET